VRRPMGPRRLASLTRGLGTLVRGRLWLQVLVGMALGVLVGIGLSPDTGWVAPRTSRMIAEWIALPGYIFLGLIQMIVIPLVVSSIIRGLSATESIGQLRRTGARAVGFFLVTTVLAITIGVGLALFLAPGHFVDQALVEETLGEAPGTVPTSPEGGLTMGEMLNTVLPRNPLGAMVNMEMLAIVVFATIVGIALLTMPPGQAGPILTLSSSVLEVCMVVVRWAMALAPIAVFGLMASITARVGVDLLVGLSAYVGTVLLGLFVLLLVYLFILRVFAKRAAWPFIREVKDVQLLAFSTSSSAAVLPLTMRTAQDRLGIRASIAQFVLPLGATINMTGTALYQGAATVFLAQVFGIELTLPQLGLIIVTAVAASIGTPATPGVGIVILSMVLTAAGVPLEGVALLLGVDRILDMSRTAVNVTGDLVAAALIEETSAAPIEGPWEDEGVTGSSTETGPGGIGPGTAL
jgi:Na+/H+-dicarboxylate symporter